MPAISMKQRRFMGAELQRKKEGKKTQTNMSIQQLREFAGTQEKGLLAKVVKKRKTLKQKGGENA